MAVEKKTSSEGRALIIAGAVITLVAAGGGAGLGLLLSKSLAAPVKVAQTATGATDSTREHGQLDASAAGGHSVGEAKQGHDDKHSSKVAPPVTADAIKLLEIAPITTKLGGSDGAWIRLEGALLYDSAIEKEMPVLSAKITEDFVIFIRSLRLSQVQGPDGLQNLIEDLNERAKTRSAGKVHQLIVSGFIIE